MADAGGLRDRITRTERLLAAMYDELHELEPQPAPPLWHAPAAMGEWEARNPWYGRPEHSHRTMAYQLIGAFVSNSGGHEYGSEAWCEELERLAAGCNMVSEGERMDAEAGDGWD